MAGFLACSPSARLPTQYKRVVATGFAGVFTELTATGTAPALHRIPFY